ncbi:Tocopherol cyclase [Sporobacter termitidis DSM 10068]|uniref:Tocopherol cyclase n=1 Tax=Sporobacter termitidis DSM 10068 TaxID=1123282 RepID=A0A1M5VQI4_9FIRM|nr:tocopherol cyclase family protein [Sporobacter termitidis]SHH77450.1 Tocopherol cyclase [Sporobacter termitidis DSM 10068]
MAGYFEGWYFKQQAGREMLALIPAVHTDGGGHRTGSLQLITPDKSWYVPLPGEALRVVRRGAGRLPVIYAGDSTFSPRGVDLNIRGDGISASGHLRYGGMAAPRGDIMGPYRFVPLMECRHSVFSMTHEVQGSLTLNGKVFDFSDGAGYMEGDRGRSFPRRYAWAQCSWRDGGTCALMVSAADVRAIGRDFVGVVGFVCLRGRELRLATYRGAKADLAGGALAVRQGDLTLTVRLLEDRHQALRAPQGGEMVRLIKESLACRARFTLTDKSGPVFDFTTDQASFEYEF